METKSTKSTESTESRLLRKAKEEMIASFNIAAIKQWIADGEPFEEHDEVLAFKEYHGITEKTGDESVNAERAGRVAHSKSKRAGRRTYINEGSKCFNGGITNKNSWKDNLNTRQARHVPAPAKGIQACNRIVNSKYSSQDTRSQNISGSNEISGGHA
ncbi:uncharacterized protein OCT59_020596 [Rhizophagus irregularis]|uniref:Uncharacterized protein n=2 Tax=Rhizophagus irregularis TaxID=588596 RepID=U9UF63_RHIID|nr:hypothetical protein GLOIN_2v1806303 [Rhizophagus irregularis DAOM 181602=DAOM 197198]EXX63231.1 hypothetical protein RirG_154290 [Rhizophagus irregularis DAOM 197198w]UZO02100.1 hypothetical protein OCT59_020596 [Rhizophagus irregularis]POG64575.1 hypothetical protein GLOIN_2v1806303 [Rhizophagus irregularis DAOM 181602=DAOM 197198]CAG8460549.1 2690_t:CDS:2 [Rhizophagus irregularis]GBC26403.1 hypothetical protein GLOIN_2v1806303 [Rhizophagus irregularis DAOM 181602=DAOM 197198]|eukprot:XP_025171441.1 hypothetical protein GLOIN_2v1806303 [Rhizophagus irregularis DAOM 181602=DAOM 197198]